MNFTRPALALPLLIFAAASLLGGCAAERPGLKSIEPAWSHHDGPAELTKINEQVWDRFAANQAITTTGLSQASDPQPPLPTTGR